MRRRSLKALLTLAVLTSSTPLLAQEEAEPADQARALQDEMREDPEIMEAVESLRDDPAVQDLLRDPSVAAALRSGDIGALLANPKIGELMEKPAVQDITRELGD